MEGCIYWAHMVLCVKEAERPFYCIIIIFRAHGTSETVLENKEMTQMHQAYLEIKKRERKYILKALSSTPDISISMNT